MPRSNSSRAPPRAEFGGAGGDTGTSAPASGASAPCCARSTRWNSDMTYPPGLRHDSRWVAIRACASESRAVSRAELAARIPPPRQHRSLAVPMRCVKATQSWAVAAGEAESLEFVQQATTPSSGTAPRHLRVLGESRVSPLVTSLQPRRRSGRIGRAHPRAASTWSPSGLRIVDPGLGGNRPISNVVVGLFVWWRRWDVAQIGQDVDLRIEPLDPRGDRRMAVLGSLLGSASTPVRPCAGSHRLQQGIGEHLEVDERKRVVGHPRLVGLSPAATAVEHEKDATSTDQPERDEADSGAASLIARAGGTDRRSLARRCVRSCPDPCAPQSQGHGRRRWSGRAWSRGRGRRRGRLGCRSCGRRGSRPGGRRRRRARCRARGRGRIRGRFRDRGRRRLRCRRGLALGRWGPIRVGRPYLRNAGHAFGGRGRQRQRRDEPEREQERGHDPEPRPVPHPSVPVASRDERSRAGASVIWATKTSTRSGSNWVPAQRRNSANASSCVLARLYGRELIIAS